MRIPRANLGPCPVCGHEIRENRKGYSCWARDDPGCGFVIWKAKAGKQLPVAVARELIKTGYSRAGDHRLQRTQRTRLPGPSRARARPRRANGESSSTSNGPRRAPNRRTPKTDTRPPRRRAARGRRMTSRLARRLAWALRDRSAARAICARAPGRPPRWSCGSRARRGGSSSGVAPRADRARPRAARARRSRARRPARHARAAARADGLGAPGSEPARAGARVARGGPGAPRARLPLSDRAERLPGARRRLQADLERYLRHAAAQGRSLEPAHLELAFGFAEDPRGLPALDLGGGLRLRGRIDRIDVAAGGEAVVYDYKGANVSPGARWIEDGRIQLALYMRAAEQLLGVRVVGGFYQPLAGGDLRARGVLDADRRRRARVRADRPGRAGRAATSWSIEAIALAREAATQAMAGAIRPRPRTCSYPGDAPIRRSADAGAERHGAGAADGMGPGRPGVAARRRRASGGASGEAANADRRAGAGGRAAARAVALAAGAGSGKTSVLVERFVRAVREDGHAPERILAITFTERAGGELRGADARTTAARPERARRRGRSSRRTSARSTAFARGCCALTRARPGSRRLSLRSSTAPSRAGCAGVRSRRRSQSSSAANAREAVDLIAAYGADRARATVLSVFAELRSRGQYAPRLPRAPFTQLRLDDPTGRARATRRPTRWRCGTSCWGASARATRRASERAAGSTSTTLSCARPSCWPPTSRCAGLGPSASNC